MSNLLPWLDAEFGWGKSTAYRFMDVAENLGKLPNLGNIEPSALYALASPSTPDDVRVEFTELAATNYQTLVTSNHPLEANRTRFPI